MNTPQGARHGAPQDAQQDAPQQETADFPAPDTLTPSLPTAVGDLTRRHLSCIVRVTVEVGAAAVPTVVQGRLHAYRANEAHDGPRTAVHVGDRTYNADPDAVVTFLTGPQPPIVHAAQG